MEQDFFKKLGNSLILILLIVLSFFILKSILMAIILGLILAFVFYPIYGYTYKFLKRKNISAVLVCMVFAMIIIIPLWFLTPILVNESIELFMDSQKIDFVTPLKSLMPSLFVSENFSNEIGSILSSFTTKLTNSFMNAVSNIILNFPIIFLQLLVVLFVFFFGLRDGDKFVSYLQGLFPFSKEVEKKLFKSSKDITFSVLYGQIVLGIFQGLVLGAGLFIFKINNALFLTIIAVLAGVLPMIGTAIVWVPVVIYLFVTGGSLWAIIGITLFGILSFLIENLFKPIFVSKRTNVHSAIILLGMIGGIIFFGILGVILGPLILSYLLILLEVYKNKNLEGLVSHPDS